MKMESTPLVLAFDPFNANTTGTPTHANGEAVRLADGRTFRHLTVGAVAISRGKIQVAPAPKTNHHNCTAIVSGALTQQPTFTLGATAAVAGEYDEGYLSVNVTPDVGRDYKIARMGAIGSAGIATPVLYEPIITAWTTATRVSLVHNACNNVVEAASATRRAAGVPLINLAIGNSGFGQTKGVSSVLADGTIALGSLIGVSGSVAGAVVVNSGTYATALATTQVGQAQVMAGVDTEYRPMVLSID